MEQQFPLHQENIMPFYLVEDRIRENFTNLSKFMARQSSHNQQTRQDIAHIRTESADFKDHIAQRLVEVQKKIMTQIGQELEGRIVVAINKNMAGFSAKMEEKQREISQVSQGITAKLEALKKTVLYEASKESQKVLAKENEKLQKRVKSSIEEVRRKVQSMGQSQAVPNAAGMRPSSKEREMRYSTNRQEPTAPENHFSEEWVLKIKELEERGAKTEDFIVSFDKRFYENMSALKESWKELGEDMLETKRRLGAKQDEMRLELIKIKGLKQFEGSPADYQETFKTKLMDKFTDLYQMLAQLITKTDFEGEVSRIKKTFSRHDNQLSDLRQEMAKNSDYFTFYANNSNEQDLSAQIKQLREGIESAETAAKDRENRNRERLQQTEEQLSKVLETINGYGVKNGQIEGSVTRMREELFKEMERIDALEEHNNFTPQKMAKIHNTLDIEFSPSEQELLDKKSANLGQNLALKELRSELSKVKDQIFVVTHELTEIEKVKKWMMGIEGKVDRIKVESDEAVLSRKPWVCLSCDKNDKEKQDLKKDSSKKRLQDAKALFGGKDKSDKLIKLIPSGEQKFEVYEKYRQKYLSDSVRLPEIYKEKIGEKEPPLG